MRINRYNVLMQEEKIPQLVKEGTTLYPELQGITSPGDAVRIMSDVFCLDKNIEENVYLIALGSQGRVLGFFHLNKGCVDCSMVDVRGMMVRLLLCNAASFLIVHNHVSGDATASKEDFYMTERLKRVSDIMGIRFLDHIIIGEQYRYFSFQEEVWSKDETG